MKLKFKAYKNQIAAIRKWNDSTTVEVLVGGAKFGGKSLLGANCIFHDALVYPETFYFIAREKLIDIRKHTIPTINEAFSKWQINLTDYCKFNGQDNYYRLHNDSRVYLLECSYLPRDPLFERFGSMQFTRGWIEEGGEVKSLAKENLLISIGRKNNDKYNLPRKLLITCNPKKNWMYQEFYKPWTTGTLPPDKAFIQLLPKDNVKGNQEYIQSLSKIKDEVMRQRLYLGNWEYDDDPTSLINYDKIFDLFSNKFVTPGEKFITADIARFGSDHTVIMLWDGWRVEEIFREFKLSVSESAKRIDSLAMKHSVPKSNILVDEDGVGGGVKDILECKGFINNSSPIKQEGDDKENFKNLKSQCYFKLADKVNEAGLYINTENEQWREMIREELEQVKQKTVDSDGKKAIQPKEWIKEQINRSPDFSDTLMMRVYFDLDKPLTAPRFGFFN
ncbi:MAG TPA: terminase [Bacteroidia bacterium]|nr:terminase [Bacteroidia bacterium]